jgi:hypothetical protein
MDLNLEWEWPITTFLSSASSTRPDLKFPSILSWEKRESELLMPYPTLKLSRTKKKRVIKSEIEFKN